MWPVRRNAIAAPIMLLAALLLGCVVPGGPVRVSAGYGIGYFGPPVRYSAWGPRYYGVWGPRYRVAPYRAPVRAGVVVSSRPAPRAFRAAPVGRAVPSIPRRRGRGRRVDYRFDDRTYARAPLATQIAVDVLPGRQTCILVALDENRELMALHVTQ